MYQIKEKKFKHIYLDKGEGYYDEILEFADDPFIIKEVSKQHPQINYAGYYYKYITQSLIFKEDDRQQRPVVVIQHKNKQVNNIWFTVCDFKENILVNSQLVHLSNFCI